MSSAPPLARRLSAAATSLLTPPLSGILQPGPKATPILQLLPRPSCPALSLSCPVPLGLGYDLNDLILGPTPYAHPVPRLPARPRPQVSPRSLRATRARSCRIWSTSGRMVFSRAASSSSFSGWKARSPAEAPARTAAWTASRSCPDRPRGPHTGQRRDSEPRWGGMGEERHRDGEPERRAESLGDSRGEGEDGPQGPAPIPLCGHPRVPRSRPRHGCGWPPAGRAGSGLAAPAAAPASAPRSAPAGEGAVGARGGPRGVPGAALHRTDLGIRAQGHVVLAEVASALPIES